MKFKIVLPEKKGSILEQIIAGRGYGEDYFNTSIADLPDMYKMKDLEKSAERIINAIRNKEKIMIFGDDDLDGITATYVLFDFLEKAGSQSHYYYIPNRLIENHGLQKTFIEKVKKGKYDLIITVDGGVSSWEAVDEINSFGTDVIITDHHLIPQKLPDAFAIVNAKQEDCDFPYTMLAGVGVSWYLCKMIAEKLNMELKPEYLFWTAVGSLADKVPLDGANRIIVKEVLDNWDLYQNEITNSLAEYLWSGNSYLNRISIIRYLIKLFANGRDVDGEHRALKFMLNPTQRRNGILKELFSEMYEWDQKLKKTQSLIQGINPDLDKYGFLFFDKNNEIDLECMGLAASFMSRDYKIPTLFLKEKADIIVCEARCTEGFDLMKMFNHLSEYLIQFGGHVKAAGFTMEKENLKDFTKQFYGYCIDNKESISGGWIYKIDAVFEAKNMDQFDSFLSKDYEKLLPFGQGNPEPVYLMKHFNPVRDSKKFKHHEMIFTDESEYDVIFDLKGSGINVLDFYNSSYGNI